MADPSEARNHPVNQEDDARLKLISTGLQAMIEIAVSNAADRVLKDLKRKCDDTPNKGYKKGKTGSSYNQSKPKEAKPECKTCKRRHWGQCRSKQKIKQCGICKRAGHQSHECRDIKNANCFSCGEKGHISTNCPKAAKERATKSGKDLKVKLQASEKTRCETCKKYHLGKCRFESQPLPCGICKSKEHKTLDCKKLKDATCYNCNEKGHIKTNCPKYARKPE